MISVIIPIYNEAESIPGVLQSLLRDLTLVDTDFEVILVDDGSTDDTLDVLEHAARDNSRIKVISFHRNFGQTAGIMAGIDHDPDGRSTMISVIIPIYNEAESIPGVLQSLLRDLTLVDTDFEVILVDDGSTDDTLDVLEHAARDNSRIKVISFHRNFGQTAGIMAGIDHAEGDILVTMDGDGQNDSADLPLLLEKLSEGYDVVSGWRKNRKDSLLRRRLPSWLANRLISRISGIKLRDYGCTLKAYRREVLENVRIYGEMHRFMPIYASWQGAKVVEIPVRHHPRRRGRSKYGLSRVPKVLLDLILIRFLEKYSQNPIYLFGKFGMYSIVGAFAAVFYMFWLKFMEGVSFILTPLPLLVTLLFMIGMMSILTGLLAEMIMRTYFEAQGKPPYTVRCRINF